MNAGTNAISMELLLEHESLVRGIVRGLLPDEHRAQDLMQETWVRALEHPPTRRPDSRGLGSWLVTVGRNLAISKQRSDSRRQRREASVARPVRDESWESSVRRIETRHRVAAAVLQLAEPYRSVVLLRYEHDLSAEEIGARLGRSPATIRSQLSRAHEILRRRLDAEFGDRRAWAILAFPATELTRAATTSTLSSVLLKGGIVAAGLIGAVTTWATWPSPEPPASGDGSVELAAVAVPAVVNRPEVQPAPVPALHVIEPVAPAPLLTRFATDVPAQPRATLFDRGTHRSYEKATFSFAQALRDDPEGITRNDWDLQFTRGHFRVNTVVNDDSAIVDLGALPLTALTPALVKDVQAQETADVIEGHLYLVRTLDADSDEATAFEVESFVEGDHCVLHWYTINHFGQGHGSCDDTAAIDNIVHALAAFRASFADAEPLTSPQVLLQVRGGAVGGNPCRIDMTGKYLTYIQGLTEQPLDIWEPVDSHDDMLAYFEGGFIPQGSRFLIYRVYYRGHATGDANGGGQLRVVVGDEILIDAEDDPSRIEQEWLGEIAIDAGNEHSVYLEISNSSAGEVRIDGELVPADDANTAQQGELMESGQVVFPVATVSNGEILSFTTGQVKSMRQHSGNHGISAHAADSNLALNIPRGRLFEFGESELSALTLPETIPAALDWLASAQAGHCYGWTSLEGRSCIFRVDAVTETDCVLDWYSWNRLGHTMGSYQPTSDTQMAAIREQLIGWVRSERPVLQSPNLRLQMRVDWDSGNSFSVDMTGHESRLELQDQPFDVTTDHPGTECIGYSEGGFIPDEGSLVVHHVTYRVHPSPNPVDHRPTFRLLIGDEVLVESEAVEASLDGTWSGQISVRHGEERRVRVEATYKIAVDVEIFGELVKDSSDG